MPCAAPLTRAQIRVIMCAILARNDSPLTREQVHEIMRARTGCLSRAAKALRVTPASIGRWLANKTVSARLDRDLPAFALGIVVGDEWARSQSTKRRRRPYRENGRAATASS